jgi:hypothetical protein
MRVTFILISSVILLLSSCNGESNEVKVFQLPSEWPFYQLDSLSIDYGNSIGENFSIYQSNIDYWQFRQSEYLLPVSKALAFLEEDMLTEEEGLRQASFHLLYGYRLLDIQIEVKQQENSTKWNIYLYEEDEIWYWLDGEISLDGKSGRWEVNKNKGYVIEYDLHASKRLSYSMLEYNFPENTYDTFLLEYKSDPDQQCDNIVEVSTTGIASNRLSFQACFSSVNKSGRIKAETLYEDSEWHCWDEALEDTDC